jgi:hypothetical protein
MTDKGSVVVPKVSQKTWKQLYDAAIRFYPLEPWKFMSEEDIFGVYDHEKKKMGYVCITGGLGAMIGLFVYRGDEGWAGYRRVLAINPEDPLEDGMFMQDCLSMELSSYKDMEKEDKQVVRKIIGGTSPFPIFRSYKPLYFPWFITESEARYLTTVLKCAWMVIKNVKDKKLRLHSHPGKIFTCFVKEETSERIAFDAQWEKLPASSAAPQALPVINESLIADMRADIVPEGIWEAAIGFQPSCIMDRERPYYVRMSIITEVETGRVLHAETITPEQTFVPQILTNAIQQTIKAQKAMPEEIRVREKETVQSLALLAQSLDISITCAGQLPSVMQFLEHTEELFQKAAR